MLSFILNPLKNSTRDPSSNNVVHAAQSINRLLRLENQSMRDSTCPKDVSNAAPGQADHSQRFCFWNMGDAAPRGVQQQTKGLLSSRLHRTSPAGVAGPQSPGAGRGALTSDETCGDNASELRSSSIFWKATRSLPRGLALVLQELVRGKFSAQ